MLPCRVGASRFALLQHLGSPSGAPFPRSADPGQRWRVCGHGGGWAAQAGTNTYPATPDRAAERARVLVRPERARPVRTARLLAACSRDGHVVSMIVLEQLAAYRLLDERHDPPNDAPERLLDLEVWPAPPRGLGPWTCVRLPVARRCAVRALCGERARRSRAPDRACAGPRRRSPPRPRRRPRRAPAPTAPSTNSTTTRRAGRLTVTVPPGAARPSWVVLGRRCGGRMRLLCLFVWRRVENGADRQGGCGSAACGRVDSAASSSPGCRRRRATIDRRRDPRTRALSRFAAGRPRASEEPSGRRARCSAPGRAAARPTAEVQDDPVDAGVAETRGHGR